MGRSKRSRRNEVSRPTGRPKIQNLTNLHDALARVIPTLTWEAPLSDSEFYGEDENRYRSAIAKHLSLIQPNTNKPQAPYRGPKLYSNILKTAVAASSAVTAPKTVCELRHSRREVMFATKRAGKAGQKKPVFTLNSKIRCK